MFIEHLTSSSAGKKNMGGFPLLPKCLPTKESYEHDERFVYEWRWLTTVRWARLSLFDCSKNGFVMKDAHWAD